MSGARLATGRPQRYVEQVMGMPISLALRGRHADDGVGRGAWQEVLATLREADRVFSTYCPDSAVSRVARGELDPAAGPPELTEVLALAELARAQSDGAFDVHRAGGFDPSGVVKGWAVERAFAPLRDLQDTDASLSAGGDLVCHVARPDSPDWRIGVEDPHDPSRLVAVVPVRSGAVATSGLAHRGGHVTDARTGAVPRAVASVTVIGAELTWTDIDATAALALDHDAVRWLATRPRNALVVWADGRSEVVAGVSAS